MGSSRLQKCFRRASEELPCFPECFTRTCSHNFRSIISDSFSLQTVTYQLPQSLRRPSAELPCAPCSLTSAAFGFRSRKITNKGIQKGPICYYAPLYLALLLSLYLSIYLSICLSLSLSIFSISLSLSVYLSIYLSIYAPVYVHAYTHM